MNPVQRFHRRSIDDRDAFWTAESEAIHWHKPFERVLDFSKPPFAKWFVGGQTNLCFNAVDRWVATRGDERALIWVSTEVDQEIPEVLYLAVAEILAFVFQVKQFNGRDGTYPNEPSNVEVPDELDPHFFEHSTAKKHNIPALLS